MSTVSGNYVHPAGQSRAAQQRQFNRLLDEAARLAESDLERGDFFRELLSRILTGCGGVAGAIWAPEPNGALHVEHEIHAQETDLHKTDHARQQHAELIRQAAPRGRALAVPPGCGVDGRGLNATDFSILIAPVVVERETVAVLEVWQDLATGLETPAIFLPFLAGMAHYTSVWLRNCKLRMLVRQQDLWLRLEAFSRLVHANLEVTETAFRIVNDGKALAGGDRLSVARDDRIIAVSGADIVERRSSQMRRLGVLCQRVLDSGDKLVYEGVADASLPPDIVQALDDYLAVCGCKLLIVVPVGKHAECFALVMECFDGDAAPPQAVERLEALGRHAGTALANAAQFERVPLHTLWAGLGRRRRGRTAFRIALLAGALSGLVAALIWVPHPLKMEATGQLLPRERRWLYSPVEGRVLRFEQGVLPGSAVTEQQPLVQMYDMQLEIKLVQLAHEVAAAQDDITGVAAQQNAARTEAERVALGADRKQKELLRDRKQAELKALREQTHADASRPGYFWLPAPLTGSILSWDFRERLNNRTVRPSEPLLRIGDKNRGWEIELRIPHRNAGPILEALGSGGAAELDVDLLLTSVPTRTFRGKLAHAQMAAEARAEPDGDNPEPVLRGAVRISGADIPEQLRIPADLLVSGTEVHAKVRCGSHCLGYALFHGVWEFLYQKVLFR